MSLGRKLPHLVEKEIVSPVANNLKKRLPNSSLLNSCLDFSNSIKVEVGAAKLTALQKTNLLGKHLQKNSQ